MPEIFDKTWNRFKNLAVRVYSRKELVQQNRMKIMSGNEKLDR